MLPRIAPLGGRRDATIFPRKDACGSEATGQFIFGIPLPPNDLLFHANDDRVLNI